MVKILVVDDDEDILNAISYFLKSKKYNVITSSSGNDALNKLKENSIDLILLDLMMPELSGFQLCLILKNDYKFRKIPIIIITAKGDLESIEKAYHFSQVKSYIAKPFQNKELLKTINEVLETKKGLGPKKGASKTIKPEVYKEIIKYYPEGIVILNGDNSVLFVNDAFEAITGFSNEDVLSVKNLPDLLKPYDDEGNKILTSEAFKACYCDKPISTAIFNIKNNKGIMIKIVTTIFKTKDVTVISLRNITDS